MIVPPRKVREDESGLVGRQAALLIPHSTPRGMAGAGGWGAHREQREGLLTT